MTKGMKVLRITLWWGILADLFEGIRLLLPGFFIESMKMDAMSGPSFDFALMYGMPVMIGWSFVLFWADRKPVERSGILICLMPVIVLYLCIEAAGIGKGLFTIRDIVPTFTLQIILFSLALVSYLIVRRQRSSTRA